jgi:ribonucleoside-diphosphate reductase alpha chain
MPRQRNGTTTKFTIGDQEGYLTVNHFEDGQPGELFINDCGKEGSTLRGVMSALATSLSLNLQYGVPLDKLVEKFSMMRFEPSGRTGDPEIPAAQSLVDYVIRKVAALAGDDDLCEEFGILTPAVRERKIARLDAEHAAATVPPPANAAGSAVVVSAAPRERRDLDGDICKFCGSSDLWVTGTCKTCRACGTSSGGCS